MIWWTQFVALLKDVALIAGGGFGLYLAWLRVRAANKQAATQQQQTELSRREHVTELFNRAAGQLADPKLEIRLAAIYTLRESTRAFPDLTGAVFELLSAYLREPDRSYSDAEPPADIREIISILRANLERRQ
ncbi:MAG: hypothetical protein ABWZ74_09005 [Hyphomicrobiaceae bacterium]|jgi:hypothetical protein